MEEDEHAFCRYRFIQWIHPGIVNKEVLIIRVKFKASKPVSLQHFHLPGGQRPGGVHGGQRFNARLPNGG